ncbi:MAG TPA: helix-turn-helix domain-containing protein, partial [Spirochaetia bacterium]
NSRPDMGRHAARGERPPTLAERVQRYIDENSAQAITTSSIARALHYNPDYLERIFRGRYDMPITEALHRPRIGRARASLNNEPDRNINEISFECGYADPGYFRRMFKRVTGLTPREFRTLYARTHINTH